MKNDQLEDLKQFIDGRVGQAEARLGERINGVEQEVKSLRAEMQEGFAGAGEAIEEINNRIDALDKHTA